MLEVLLLLWDNPDPPATFICSAASGCCCFNTKKTYFQYLCISFHMKISISALIKSKLKEFANNLLCRFFHLLQIFALAG